MKKLIALVLVLLLMGAPMAFAEPIDPTAYTDEELVALFDSLQAELESRGLTESDELDLTALTDEELAALLDSLNAEIASRGTTVVRATLQKGSNGEAVIALQKRLIELSYLSGSADGDYGNKTKSAVELFQKEAGLTVTGIADPETQDKLFAEDAPVAKVYLDLDFKAISRDPDSYTGKNYKFSGKVLQVMEEESDSFTYVVMRIATKGNYDDVVYVTYLRDNGEARILEDDRVTVYATCLGLYTYETVMGSSVTLPDFLAETVSLN